MGMSMNNYRITELTIINKNSLAENQHANLSYQYRILNKTSTECAIESIATLSLADENDSEDKSFSMKIVIQGFFSYADMDERALRKQGGQELLPFLRTHIATAMASIGLDPIVIPIQRVIDLDEN